MANVSAQNLLGMDRNIQGRPVMEAVLNHHLLELIQKVHLLWKDFLEKPEKILGK